MRSYIMKYQHYTHILLTKREFHYIEHAICDNMPQWDSYENRESILCKLILSKF